jgi:hypothetical protein
MSVGGASKIGVSRSSQARRTDLETSSNQIGDAATFALIQVKYSEKAKQPGVAEGRPAGVPGPAVCGGLDLRNADACFAPPQIFAARIKPTQRVLVAATRVNGMKRRRSRSGDEQAG